MEKDEIKPKTRFKEYSDSWNKKKISDVLIQRTEHQTISPDAPLLAFSYAEGVISPENKKTNKRDFLMTDKYSKIFSRTEIDDIIYNPANVIHGAIHRNKLQTGVVSPIYKIFKCNNASAKYMGEYLHTDFFIKEITKYIEGTVIKLRTLSPEKFLDMDVNMPNTIEEQEKIGEFFESINVLISNNQKKYEKLVNVKKALLNKMFPNGDSISPSLRFNGYNEEWVEMKLSDLCNIYDGTHQTPNYKKSGVMFLSVENIRDLKSKKYISIEDFYKNFKIYPEKNDILMTRIGDIGTTNIVKNDEMKAFYVSLALLKCKSINSLYLNSAIRSNYVQNGLRLRSLLTATPMKINKDQIGEVEIKYPTNFKEQEKIGEFFDKLDMLINLYNQKITKLQNTKKALLSMMLV